MTATREAAIEVLREELGQRALAFEHRSERRVFVEVAPEDVLAATRLLGQQPAARFQTASGIDTPAGFEILYHWALDRLGLVVSIRSRLPREAPEIESIANLCPAAEWIEREMWELLGIRFRNHPDLRHLLLPEDWPEGSHPLRRDYQR
ncbi:MAG: NADH-quinone oxidoreductase subunit C [Myxococcota bacterium]|nr:NADH-quinone oxidoreductase subunit C [Myxococcota bacterium]